MTEQNVNDLYDMQTASTINKQHISKVFAIKDKPDWLTAIGDVSLTDTGKWALNLPQFLVAQVAGHEHKLDRDFVVATDTTFFSDVFELLSENIINAKPFSINKFDDFYLKFAIKGHLKSLTASWATAAKALTDHWKDKEFMQNLILPSIRCSIEALKDYIRHIRNKWLPAKVPRDLRQRVINMPFSQIYPSDAETLNQLKQFFRAQPSARGRQRFGYFRYNKRGARGRVRIFRGFRGGYRYDRGYQRGYRFRQGSQQRPRDNTR